MRTILGQTFWLFSAQALTRVIGFFYTIYLARNLGVSDFGLYSTAFAFFSLISSVADFGFNRYLMREMALGRQKIAELIFNVALLRLLITSVLFGISAVILFYIDPDKYRISLELLATLAVLPQSVAMTFDAVFAALKKLQFSALALLLASLSTALAGIYLVQENFGVIGGVNALIIGQVIYFLVSFILTFRLGVVGLTKVTWPILKSVTQGSLPYGLLGILGLLYFKIDTLLLSYIRGSFETGLYAAAYKFLESIIFIPSSISVALFPVLARLHQQNPAEIKKIYWKSLKLMGLVSIGLTIGFVLVLPPLIILFLPNYIRSIGAIKILSLAIPFMFIHVPAVQVLLSTDKYLKEVIRLSFLTLGFNIIANLIFIPQFGLYAASVVTALSEVFSFIVFFLLLKRRSLI